MDDQRYKVNIGLSVLKQEVPGFADFGLTYEDMPYEAMVQVEAAFAKHATAITEAMGPLIQDLVQMGFEESPNRMGKHQPPGAMR